MSSDEDDFDIDHQIVLTNSSTSSFVGLFQKARYDEGSSSVVEDDDPQQQQLQQLDDDDRQLLTNTNRYYAPEVVIEDDGTTTSTTPAINIERGMHHHHATTVTEEEVEVEFRDMRQQPTTVVDIAEEEEENDHREDGAYETDEYSQVVNEDEIEGGEEEEDVDVEEEEEGYPTEVEEEETTLGEEFTVEEEEGDDDDEEEEEDDDTCSVGSAMSAYSYNTLLNEIEHNDTSLRILVIDTTAMDRPTAEDMAQLIKQNTSISTIRLSCKRLQHKEGRTRKLHILSTLLSGIRDNTSIESIEVEDTDISYELARTLSQLCARKQSLKNIAMIQCQFIGSGLSILMLGMQHSQSIRNVIFQSCDLSDQSGGGRGGESRTLSSSNLEVIASALPFMNLTSLSLVDVHFPTEECLHYLIENVEHAKELKLLDLSQNKLDVRSVAYLSKSISRQNQITRLILSSCSMDNACAKELAVGLRGYDQLTNLDVSKNRFLSDRGALQLRDLLKGNSKITKLNVSGCRISGTSLDALEAALRYNNSFLKTFVSVSTGQQIFDVVDAIANLGADDEDYDYDDEEDEVEEERRRRRSSRQHRHEDRRKQERGAGKPQSESSRSSSSKQGRSSSVPSSPVERVDVDDGRSPKRYEMRSLFQVAPQDNASSFDWNVSTESSFQRDIKSHPSLQGQKMPRSSLPPPPPPPPPPTVTQGMKDNISARRSGNLSPPHFFNDQFNFDDKSSQSSHSGSGTKYSSAQRINSNVLMNSSEEFFPSGSGHDFPASPQYSSPRSPRRSNNNLPQYEFSSTSSSQSGSFKPTRQDVRSAKYLAQRKTATQQTPKIDKVIAQLSPSRRDVASARSPKGGKSPRGSSSGNRVML